jgi:hypothetical protein
MLLKEFFPGLELVGGVLPDGTTLNPNNLVVHKIHHSDGTETIFPKETENVEDGNGIGNASGT